MVIEDPEANTSQPAERVERVLHFWSNGFSIDDGDLYDTSDPQNAMMLEMIPIRCPRSNMRHGVRRIAEMDLHIRQAFESQMRSATLKWFTTIGHV